jgi:hypothetical protein
MGVNLGIWFSTSAGWLVWLSISIAAAWRGNMNSHPKATKTIKVIFFDFITENKLLIENYD